MKITKVRYYDIENTPQGYYLSRCSIVLDNCVVIHDIKVLQGKKGRYIIMPIRSSKSFENSEAEDVFHPVDKSYFSYMKDVVLQGYEMCINEGVKVYNP